MGSEWESERDKAANAYSDECYQRNRSPIPSVAFIDGAEWEHYRVEEQLTLLEMTCERYRRALEEIAGLANWVMADSLRVDADARRFSIAVEFAANALRGEG